MNETEFPAITCNFLKAQDKLRVQGCFSLVEKLERQLFEISFNISS